MIFRKTDRGRKAADFLRFLEKSGARVAVSLSSGGAEAMGRNLALLEMLTEHAIPINELHGSSAGAAVSAAYAGWDVEAGDRIFPGDSGRKSVGQIRTGFLQMARTNNLIDISRDSLRALISSRSPSAITGIFAGKKLETKIGRGYDNMRFADCRRDLHIYAEKEEELELEVFNRQTHPDVLVHEAVRASISIPYFFEPKELGGKNYIDGGMLAHTPLRMVVNNHLRRNPRQPLVLMVCTSLYPYQPISFSENIWEVVKNRYFYKILSRIFFLELAETLQHKNVHVFLFYPEVEPIKSFAFHKLEDYLLANKMNFSLLFKNYLKKCRFPFGGRRMRFSPGYDLGFMKEEDSDV